MKNTVKNLLKCFVVFIVALVLGIGTAIWAIVSPPKNLTANNGPWRTNLAVGSPQNGMYLRATVSLMGLFALNRSETIYFVAEADGDGKSLHSGCDYRVEGSDLDARWWSITLYGRDTMLIPNEQERYSYNGGNVEHDESGKFVIVVDGRPGPGYDWVGDIEFSRDSKHIAYRAKAQDRWVVALDGQPDPQYDRILCGPVFRRDGPLEFLAMRHKTVYRVKQHLSRN